MINTIIQYPSHVYKMERDRVMSQLEGVRVKSGVEVWEGDERIEGEYCAFEFPQGSQV